jgi:hypothetical protein
MIEIAVVDHAAEWNRYSFFLPYTLFTTLDCAVMKWFIDIHGGRFIDWEKDHLPSLLRHNSAKYSTT